MVGRELWTMAKKTSKNPDQPGVTPPPAPARRRAPAKKSTAAAPVDIATVGRTEQIDTAADSGATPSNSTPRANAGRQPSHEEIAEAAYFRHLRRGGQSGDEFNDWVEAERELKDLKEGRR